jgi:hypothetical protein
MAKVTFKVKKQADGKLKYICACGSEMWDNTTSKTNPKAPDLKCKSQECSLGKNSTPNAVWLTDGQKEKLGVPKQATIKKQEPKGSRGGSRGNVGTDMQVSYYGAWAKDMALYLAEKNGVKTSAELQTLYDACLEVVGSSLKKHISKVVNTNTPEEEKTKPVDETDNLNLDEPEDVKDPEEIKVDDDTVDVGGDDSGDVDLSGLDDVEI